MFLFSCFSVFAEENKIESKEIKYQKQKETNKEFGKDNFLYFSLDFEHNAFYEIGISKLFNDYLELLIRLAPEKSSNRLISSLKIFPFKNENDFFIEGGLGAIIRRNFIISDNSIFTNKESISFPYYFGLGYDVRLSKNVQIGILASYSNIIKPDKSSDYPIYSSFPFSFRLSLIIPIN